MYSTIGTGHRHSWRLGQHNLVRVPLGAEHCRDYGLNGALLLNCKTDNLFDNSSNFL